MARILVSWLGQTDIRHAVDADPSAPGPIGEVLAAHEFDSVVILNNYPKKKAAPAVEWLRSRTASKVHFRDHPEMDNPTDFTAIRDAFESALDWIGAEYSSPNQLVFHISSGTPQMQAISIVFSKTSFPAELIQSSRESGVETVFFPFDLSAEYVASVLSGPDEKAAAMFDDQAKKIQAFKNIMSESKVMKVVLRKVQKVAPRNLSVLILGEPGTGKEGLARAIHELSTRASGPFIEVNCATIPADTAESELFGHDKGAFTGADKARKGHFEKASGGTIFLDEIGELPLSQQPKLLRVLQQKTIVRMGESQTRPVDVRIVAATNRDLLQQVDSGRFRDDLYERLALAVLQLPPLRDRRGDLGPAIDEFLENALAETADQPGHMPKKLSPKARNLLLQYSWPRNVRQLDNTIKRLCLWTEGTSISEEDVRNELLQMSMPGAGSILERPMGDDFKLDGVLNEVKRHYLERAMDEAGGVKSKAADLVGASSAQTFDNWLKQVGADTKRKAR